MIIYGTRLFGKVDAIPGVGHVATKFFHIDYLPLIPTESWLVTQQTGKSWRGVKIPFSAKSVVVAWARAASVAVGILAAIFAVAAASGNRTDTPAVVSMAVVSAVAWGVFALTKMHKLFNRASYARACQLAKMLKLNDNGMAALAAAYNQPPPTYGFRPVMASPARPAPAAAVVPVDPVPEAVDMGVDGEDDQDAPIQLADEVQPPQRAAKPLRGY